MGEALSTRATETLGQLVGKCLTVCLRVADAVCGIEQRHSLSSSLNLALRIRYYRLYPLLHQQDCHPFSSCGSSCFSDKWHHHAGKFGSINRTRSLHRYSTFNSIGMGLVHPELLHEVLRLLVNKRTLLRSLG